MAKTAVAAAAKELEVAKTAALAKIAATPAYRKVSGDVEHYDAEIKRLRASGDRSLLAAMSQKWIEAKGERNKLEAAAIGGDAGVAAAVKKLSAAEEAVRALGQPSQ